MTAMVDVAFLLLTFFVLTAMLTTKSMMELTMPPDTNDQGIDIVENKVMTLILDENDKIGYYVGITNPQYQETDYSPMGLRNALIDHLTPAPDNIRCKSKQGARTVKNCWDPIFVVKARDASKFRNLVDVLDELAIVKAPKYAISKFSAVDSLIMIGEYDYYANTINP